MTWSSWSRYSPLSFFRGQHEGDRVPPVPVEVVLEVELDRRVGGEVLELGERPDREHVMVGHHEVLRHQEARGDRALAFPAVEVADQAEAVVAVPPVLAQRAHLGGGKRRRRREPQRRAHLPVH